MAFVKRTIKDRVIQYPKRYQIVEVSPGVFDFVPVTGTITEVGTPVNKDLLQRYEDTLNEHDLAIPNKLDINGDSKDNVVTFPTQSHVGNILSGEKHETLFSKIRFWLQEFIAHGLDNVRHITATERTTWNGKAPNSHASSATTYGIATATNYGHAKSYNGLGRASYVEGEFLSSNQGKILDDKKLEWLLLKEQVITATTTISVNLEPYSEILIELLNTTALTNNSNGMGGTILVGNYEAANISYGSPFTVLNTLMKIIGVRADKLNSGTNFTRAFKAMGSSLDNITSDMNSIQINMNRYGNVTGTINVKIYGLK